MASKKSISFSDDELLAELKKLGYNDVTPDVFNMMKNDLSVLVHKDNISSRKPKNMSSITYSSNPRDLKSTKDEISDSKENGTSVLLSNDSIKKDLYSKYKSRFNSFGLNIETTSPLDQQSSIINQETSVNCKKDVAPNIVNESDGRVAENSKPTAKSFLKSSKKFDSSSNVSQVVIKSNSHLAKPSSDKERQNNDKSYKPKGEIKNLNGKSNSCDSNQNSESNFSTSVRKTHRKDNSVKIDYNQDLCKSDKNKFSGTENKLICQDKSKTGSISKENDFETESKMHKIAMMTNKTKATVEYQSLKLLSKSESRSSLKHVAASENVINGVEHQNNLENRKPEGTNSMMSSSKSISRNYNKPQKINDHNPEKNESNVKNISKNKKPVESDSLTSSVSTHTTTSIDPRLSKRKESCVKSVNNIDSSNSVLSVCNRQFSPKLPSIDHSRGSSKTCDKNISSPFLDSSNEVENHDSKYSRFPLDSSYEADSNGKKFVGSPSSDSTSPEIDSSLPKYRFSSSNIRQPESTGLNQFSGVTSVDSSLQPEDPLEKYRRRFKFNAYSSQEDLLGSSSVKIKRKVLRHRNGQSIVTEELLNVPSIFTSSYPSTELGLESSKSFSSDDLSLRTSVVPEVFRSSYSTPRSIHVRIAGQRKKKG